MQIATTKNHQCWKPVIRGIIALACAFCWSFLPIARAQEGPQKLDPSKLNRLLSSKKIDELRRAHLLLKLHPIESIKFVDAVARRANHPELRRTFKMLVSRSHSAQLRKLLDQSETQQKELIHSELKNRSTQPAASPSNTTSSRQSPAASTNVPPSVNSGSQAANPVTSRSPTRPPFAGPMVGPPFGGMRSGGRPGDPSAPNYQLRQVAQSFSMIARTRVPTKEETKPILDAFDAVDEKNPQERTFLYEFRNALMQHSAKVRPHMLERFYSKTSKHPERLMPMLLNGYTGDGTLFDRVWELAQSEDPAVAREAIRTLARTRSNHEKYAKALLAHQHSDSSVVDAMDYTLQRLSSKVSPETRSAVLTHFFDKLESWQPRSPATSQQFANCLKEASRMIAGMSEANQKGWFEVVLRRIPKAKSPAQFIKLSHSFSCDLMGIVSPVRRLLATSPNDVESTACAIALIKAGHDKAQAQAILHRVLRNESWTPAMSLAIDSMPLVGDDASKFVGDLSAILVNPKTKNYEGAVLNAFLKMGPLAKDATPTLIKLLHDPNRRHHTFLISAIGKVGKDHRETVPGLIKMLEHENVHTKYWTIDALRSMGPAAKQALPILTKLQDDPRMSSRCRRAIEAINRVEN